MGELRNLSDGSPLIERDLFQPSGGPAESDYQTETPALPAGVFNIAFSVDAALWLRMRSALMFGAAVQFPEDYFNLIQALNQAEQTAGQSLMAFPNQITLFHFNSRPGNLSPYETTIIPTTFPGYETLQQPLDHAHFGSSPALGDSFSQDFYLAAGSYDFTVLGILESAAGIITWALDGVDFGSQDWYASYPIANIWQTIPNVLVPEGGLHTLRGTMTGTNPLSGQYFGVFTLFSFRQRPE